MLGGNGIEAELRHAIIEIEGRRKIVRHPNVDVHPLDRFYSTNVDLLGRALNSLVELRQGP